MIKRITLFIYTILLSFNLMADTILLKDGKIIDDIKVEIKDGLLVIRHPNGKEEQIKSFTVKSLKPKPVTWVLSNIKEEDRKAIYERERLRVANALLENTDWTIPEEEKPRLIFIPFSAGSVPKDIVEAYSNIIKTKISKTGLFTVIDSASIQKVLSESKCKAEDCAKHIPPELRANKMLTGNITSAGSYIFIQGDVVDIKTKKIDFSESVIIEDKSKEGIEQAAELFAKKITGGTMAYLEGQAMENPYKGSVDKLPMLWRSALVPGWGQWRDGSPKKAIAFFSTAVVGVIGYSGLLYDMKQKEKAYNGYKGIPNIGFSEYTELYFGSTYLLNYNNVSQKHNLLEKSQRNANSMAYFVASVWALNILDIVLFAEGEMASKKEIKATVSPDSVWNLNGVPGINLSAHFSFHF